MKTVKKLMALVLASALALTLLTGCGGGGGGGGGGGTGGLPDLAGKSYTMNGVTITLGSANNANTSFTQAFIATFSQLLNMKMSYSVEDGRRVQKFVDETYKVYQTYPDAVNDESGIYAMMALQNAGIDINKQMIFTTEKTSLQDQIADIITQMIEFESELGRGINCDGKTFGYITANRKDSSGNNKTVIYALVNYTLV